MCKRAWIYLKEKLFLMEPSHQAMKHFMKAVLFYFNETCCFDVKDFCAYMTRELKQHK